MVEPNLLLAFIAAVTLLMLIPGPNVALIVANSVTHGVRAGLVTVAGTVAAQALSLALVTAGLTALLAAVGAWFVWLRWAGAAYLIWLGIKQWRAAAPDLAAAAQPRAALFAEAFLVSLVNPKTLIFYGAFFPQFISLSRPVLGQAALLSLVFLAIAAVMDSGWALAAARVRPFLARRGRLTGRLTGAILVGAGTALALLRRS
ncbi:MAG: LysE family translocator [Alphaproteobacteria bacterium]|nr:LysE family translocator [Alphaproteobacteria bacterium]